MKKKVILIMDFFAFHSKKASELLHNAKYLFLLLVLMSSAHGNLFSENNEDFKWLTPGDERRALAHALQLLEQDLQAERQAKLDELKQLDFLKRWLPSAQQGNAYAQYKMGLHSNGKLIRYWYKLAAQKGQKEAVKWLCEYSGYYDTIAIKRPSGILLEVFKTSLKKTDKRYGNPEYGKYGARAYPEDPLYDAYQYLNGTNQNNASDMYNLACCYMKGIKSNEKKAIILLQQAADLGYTDAQTLLSTIFMKKILKGENCVELVNWFNKYAEKNWVIAQYYLGLLYYNGIVVDKDYNYAVYWFEKAAYNGCAEAQLDLSYCYFNGYGVKKNYNKGHKWYHCAEISCRNELKSVDFNCYN